MPARYKVLIALSIAAAAIIIVELLSLEGDSRQGDLQMRAGTEASGEGFKIRVPRGYLIVDDERVSVPPGSVALGGEQGDGRSTIVVSPYMRSDDNVFSEEGCREVTKLQAKQVGAQLSESRFIEAPPQCIGHLDEGGGVAGVMVLVRSAANAFMITCRFPTSAGPEACLTVATSLQPAQKKLL